MFSNSYCIKRSTKARVRTQPYFNKAQCTSIVSDNIYLSSFRTIIARNNTQPMLLEIQGRSLFSRLSD